MHSKNLYTVKPPGGNFTENILNLITVSPEDIIADARDAGLILNSVEDFRNLPPAAHHIIEHLTNRYIDQAARWCAFSGATSGAGGVVTAITLGIADFINVAGRLYRLCLQLAILNGLDPRDPVCREAIEESYLSALNFDVVETSILRGVLGRPGAKSGRLRTSFNYARFVIAVGRKLWARRLASRVTGRFFPLFGAIAGAGSNYHFARKAGRNMSNNLRRTDLLT